MKTFQRLNKNEMKMIVGGNYPTEELEGGGGNCLSTYFYNGPEGCGYVRCYNYNVDGSCQCTKTIEYSQPCGYA